MKIKAIRALEVLDSRGWPTLEVEAFLRGGASGRAAVPSGASTGEHEALELRDGDARRYRGKGVLKAVSHVELELAPALIGLDAGKQRAIDEKMLRLDATPDKGRLGANAVLGVSMAVSRAAASGRGMPLYDYLRKAFGLDQFRDYLLPTPMFNILNGGKHADSGLDVQEFMVVPVGASSFSEALRMGSEVYHELKELLAGARQSVAVGDEGGFAPRLGSQEEALGLIGRALSRCSGPGAARMALDCAASEFYGKGTYRLEGKALASHELAERYLGWISRFPIASIEDPFDQDDWNAWRDFTAQVGDRLRVIGDDLFVTNLERLRRGIRERSANAVLIKLNQIGTVSETVSAVLEAQEAGFSAVISHRSGETEDSYIADLAVALNAGAIKAGAPCRSERLAKYNQLLRIESALGPKAGYAGDSAFRIPSTLSRRTSAGARA